MLLAPPVVYHVDEQKVLTLTNISGLKFVDDERNHINCMIVIQEYQGEPLPFTASKFDKSAHGREIYNDIMSGVYGEIAEPDSN